MDYTTQIVFLILCAKCVAVNIKQIEVPALVEIGTEFVILDCQYSIDSVSPRAGLVMKWFFNGSSGLVYQWIPPLRPQVIGLLKGKVDMNFRISDEPLQMYRAIKILKPSTDLSGNYTCVVSTFLEEDRQTRSMLVYNALALGKERRRDSCIGFTAQFDFNSILKTWDGEIRNKMCPTAALEFGTDVCFSRGPARSFHFFQEKKYVFLVTLICIAEDMYPKPTMVILSQGSPLKQAVAEVEMDSWGLYTVTTKVVVHDDDVSSPWEEFTCMINIPQANYTVNKTTTYYPGFMPTAYIAAYEIQKPEERYVSGNTAATSMWGTWISTALCIVICLQIVNNNMLH